MGARLEVEVRKWLMEGHGHHRTRTHVDWQPTSTQRATEE